MMSYKKYLKLLLKIIISISILVIIFRKIDIDAIKVIFQNISYYYLAYSLIFLFIAYLLSVIRLWILSKAYCDTFSPWYVAKIYLISTAYNQVLPSAIGGDAIRIFFMKSDIGLANSVALNLLDRVIGFIGLLGVFIVFFSASDIVKTLPLDNLPAHYIYYFIFFVIFGVIIIYLGARNSKHYQKIKRFVLEQTRVGLSKYTIISLIISVLIHVLNTGVFSCIGTAIGVKLEFVNYLSVIPLIVIATMIPISFGGWGVRESSAVALFLMVGVQPSESVTISVLFGLFNLLFAVPGVFLIFNHKESRNN